MSTPMKTALCLLALGLLGGCGQAAESNTATEDDALMIVNGCMAQADTCKGDAERGKTACDDKLRGCLGRVAGDAGATEPKAPHMDGGHATPSRSPRMACIEDLLTCLRDGSKPRTCGEEARTCLQAARGDGGRR